MVPSRVLRFPVAEGHAQFVQQRAVDEARVLGGGCRACIFGEKTRSWLPAPALEQVAEGAAHHAFAVRAAHPLQPVELREVLVDQDLAHVAWGYWPAACACNTAAIF